MISLRLLLIEEANQAKDTKEYKEAKEAEKVDWTFMGKKCKQAAMEGKYSCTLDRFDFPHNLPLTVCRRAASLFAELNGLEFSYSDCDFTFLLDTKRRSG